jgi:nitrite reductase/ring-hydroxylating ferredoxin subunit
MAFWIDAVAATDLPDGVRRMVCTEGLEIALFQQRGGYHAIEDSCPTRAGCC